MQALEKIGVLEQDEEKGGRRITQSGQRDLDRKCLRCFLFKDSFSVELLAMREKGWNGKILMVENEPRGVLWVPPRAGLFCSLTKNARTDA